ncbi:POTRA domain-containing protein [Sinimarinibacterium thermocellulolyticum]|uniref:POTRA domain-containing protein n=1 Tax=Sinimarinibacterium thermocellulolyticum TaxID=3170016 RepID=A0ABV2ABM7_9GAMM
MRARPVTRWAGAVAALQTALMLAAAGPCCVAGADAVRVAEIVFEGNEHTRVEVLRREVVLQPGDVLDAARVEQGRQQIQNLGLFRSVDARIEPMGEAARVVYTVREKWFWQLYPRLSANSEGQNSLGGEVRLSNLWGLNHSLRLIARSRDTREADRGRDLSVRASYVAPYLLSERDSLRLALAHNQIPYEAPMAYDETIDEIELVVMRTFGLPERPGQGWSLGGGPLLRRQRVSDETLARSFGDSLGWVSELSYRNGRDLIFSDDGRSFWARHEIADRSLLSDYSYSVFRLSWEQALPIGTRAHQQFVYGLSLGVGNHALDHRALFSLGGIEGLKGYERRAFEGNSFYLAHAEWLRPLYWDSLRGVIGIELGNADWQTRDLLDTPKVSLNLGLRLRPRRLTQFELELGFAVPLGGDDPRFYGGKIERR